MAMKVFTLFRKIVRPGFHTGHIHTDGWDSDMEPQKEGRLEVWGDNREPELLAVGLGGQDLNSEEYHTVRAGKNSEGTIVLVPSQEPPETDRCLVLVHEVSPGCGWKRWPSFYIDWNNAGPVQILSRVRKASGSESYQYTLLIAPADWPQNIACQFVDERDYGGQIISYQPPVLNVLMEEAKALSESGGVVEDIEEAAQLLAQALGARFRP